MDGKTLFSKFNYVNVLNIDNYIIYHYKKIFNVMKTAVEKEKIKPNDFFLFINYYIIQLMSAIKIKSYKDFAELLKLLKFDITTENDFNAACNNVLNGDDNTKQLLDNLLSNVIKLYFDTVKEQFDSDSDYNDALADFTILVYLKLYTRPEVNNLFSTRTTIVDAVLQFSEEYSAPHFDNRFLINEIEDFNHVKKDMKELMDKYPFVYSRIFSACHINHVTNKEYNEYVFTKVDLGLQINDHTINKLEIVLRYTENFDKTELEMEEDLKEFFNFGKLLIIDSTKNTVDYRLTYVLNLVYLGDIKYAYDGLDDDPYIKLNITDELYFEDPISGNQFKEQLINKFNRVPLKEAKIINHGVIKACKKNKIDHVFDVERADEFNAAENAYNHLQQIYLKYNTSK